METRKGGGISPSLDACVIGSEVGLLMGRACKDVVVVLVGVGVGSCMGLFDGLHVLVLLATSIGS